MGSTGEKPHRSSDIYLYTHVRTRSTRIVNSSTRNLVYSTLYMRHCSPGAYVRFSLVNSALAGYIPAETQLVVGRRASYTTKAWQRPLICHSRAGGNPVM
jgi:hypothetical protein